MGFCGGLKEFGSFVLLTAYNQIIPPVQGRVVVNTIAIKMWNAYTTSEPSAISYVQKRFDNYTII